MHNWTQDEMAEYEDYLDSLSELEFEFYDQYGNLIDFDCSEHSFTLRIITKNKVPLDTADTVKVVPEIDPVKTMFEYPAAFGKSRKGVSTHAVRAMVP